MNRALTPLFALLFVSLCRVAPAGPPEDFIPAIDFSFCGYNAGEKPLPSPPAVFRMKPSGEDDTFRLQSALDAIAKRPLAPDGFRGALLLDAGTFRVSGSLALRQSGVILRGTRAANKATKILATGLGRRTLIEVGEVEQIAPSTSLRVTDERVPAGSRVLHLENVTGLKEGTRVVVTRPSTAEWISSLEMVRATGPYADQRVNWAPGSHDVVWDRTVVAVDPADKKVLLDAPLTVALEQRFGGGKIGLLGETQPKQRIGVEDLVLESEYDPNLPADEEHAWTALAIDHVTDAWVQRVRVLHFVGSAVRVGARARRVTVAEVRSEAPVSELGGYRRQSFFVEGQQVLVTQCRAEDGLNDFASGCCVGGPNVFLDCTSTRAHGASGAAESWACGVLYEGVHVEGAGLKLSYDIARAQGGGWTAANCVVWNCSADPIEVRGPSDAPNLAQTSPESLIARQLMGRLGRASPLASENLSVLGSEIREFIAPPAAPIPRPVKKGALQIVNGRFVIEGQAVWGGSVNDAWWLGQMNPATAPDSGVSITRYAPGRIGPGLTEDLPTLAARMVAEGTPFYQSGPALWYDRRRDEHSIVERLDKNVWAPFYELPWARTGRGKAWDGLSLYDLSKYNPWYFTRTRDFAQLCEQHGLVFYHSLYNTHNLLEIGPHWMDYPWRPANCVNETGLPEPPPLEPRDRLHVANAFYSVTHPGLRALHRAYIHHVLDELGTEGNILFSLGFQFPGPLAFAEFFQDSVAEWEARTGHTVRLVLATSKDITDAILADPKRARQVGVIDMRYWQYRPDGTLWAPPGGTNHAFREMIAEKFGKLSDAPPPTTVEQLYRQVREYRDRFPEKAMVAWHSDVGPIPILMAGGAQALMRNPTAGHNQGRLVDQNPFDFFVHEYLAPVLAGMVPGDDVVDDAARTWSLADKRAGNVLIYSLSGGNIKFIRTLSEQPLEAIWYDPRTGVSRRADSTVLPQKDRVVTKPTDDAWLLYLRIPIQRAVALLGDPKK